MYVATYVVNLKCMCNVLLVFTAYNVSITSIPHGYPVIGANNTNEYFYGSDVRFTCSVTPIPPAGHAFSWSCSNGCFADRQKIQTISVFTLDEADSGVLNCSVIVSGIQYSSEPFQLQVITSK